MSEKRIEQMEEVQKEALELFIKKNKVIKGVSEDGVNYTIFSPLKMGDIELDELVMNQIVSVSYVYQTAF